MLAATFTFEPITRGGSRFLQEAFTTTSLGDFIQSVFNLAVVFGGVVAVLRIAYGGFLYMTSDIADTKSQAKSVIASALSGLLLLLAIVIILQQINPNILDLRNLDLEQVDVSSPQQQGSSRAPAQDSAAEDTVFGTGVGF